MAARKKFKTPLDELLWVMAQLRSPKGCPWDREQDHMSLRFHAVEEVYELIDAIESGDDAELEEELGDLLLQVVFHCQLARERDVFDFQDVARNIAEKLIRRHPHVFGTAEVKTVEGVWKQWEQIKKAEKAGTSKSRESVFDGIPRHLPALMRAEKLVKKARKASLMPPTREQKISRQQLEQQLFELVQLAQSKGWSAEELLRRESSRREKHWRKVEKSK